MVQNLDKFSSRVFYCGCARTGVPTGFPYRSLGSMPDMNCTADPGFAVLFTASQYYLYQESTKALKVKGIFHVVLELVRKAQGRRDPRIVLTDCVVVLSNAATRNTKMRSAQIAFVSVLVGTFLASADAFALFGQSPIRTRTPEALRGRRSVQFLACSSSSPAGSVECMCVHDVSCRMLPADVAARFLSQN